MEKPLVVAALPHFANLPGIQDISRKLQACIQAQTSAERIRQISEPRKLFASINRYTGIQIRADMPKTTSEPFASLLKRGFLCNAVIILMLAIENIGRITDISVPSAASLLNASQ